MPSDPIINHLDDWKTQEEKDGACLRRVNHTPK